MELDGGYNLYGNKSTAILHEKDTGLDIHYHNYGGGALYYKDERICELPWEKQKKLTDYL